MEPVEEVAEPYEIIDQAVALRIDMLNSQVDAITQIRIKINNFDHRVVPLNLLQPEIQSFRLHSVQLYLREKDKVTDKGLEKFIEGSCDFIAPGDVVGHLEKVYTERVPRNLHHFETLTSKLNGISDAGEVAFRWQPENDEKKLEKIRAAYSKGWQLFFTLEVETSVVSPMGGAFFHVFSNKVCFIKDSSFGSARSLFPCQDSMDKNYFFSTLKVTVNDLGAVALCSGELQSIQQSKTEKCFEYKIDRNINPSFLGITVGEFYEYPAGTFATSFFSLDAEINQGDCEKIIQSLVELEPLVIPFDGERSFFVLLPGVFHNDLNCDPLNRPVTQIPQFFFYNFYLVNSELLLPPKYPELNPFILSTFLKAKFLSKVIELMRFTTEDHLWILIGTVVLVDDAVVFLVNGQDSFSALSRDKRCAYFEAVERGVDRHCLGAPHFFSPNQAFQEPGYIFKCNLAFLSLTSFLKLNKQNYRSFFSIFAKKRILSYDNFMKKLVKKFTLPNREELEEKLEVFVNHTGTLQLEISSKLFKKDSKMEIQISQVPLTLAYFRDSNRRRFEIEDYHSLISKGHEVTQAIRGRLEALVNETEGIKKNELLAEGNTVVLANATRDSLKKVKCHFEINLIEFYKEEGKYEENLHKIILEKSEDKFTLPLKSRFRRNYNKKSNPSKGEERAAPGTSENLEATLAAAGNDSVLERSQTGVAVDNKESLSEEDSENISFRIVADPKKHFLFDIVSKDSKVNILEHIRQALERRESLLDQLELLDDLVRQPDKQIFGELVEFLNKKGVSPYLHIRVLRTLRKSKDIVSEFRIVDILMDIVLTRKFEKDGTIRQSKFENEGALASFLEVVKSLVALEKRHEAPYADTYQKDGKIVKIVLDLVKKNESSINSDDSDSFYQAFLLKILLKSSKSLFFDKICKEILRYLKTETYNNPKLKFAIAAIFRYFGTFIHTNMRYFHYPLDPNLFSKFSQLAIFLENENLKPVIEHFENLRQRLRSNPLIAPSIFAHKLFVKRRFQRLGIVPLLVYGFKYANKEGHKFGSLTKFALVRELLDFMVKNREEIQSLQRTLPLRSINGLSDVIWAQLNCGSSIVDTRLRTLYLRMHELIFDEYIPISHTEADKDSLFPVDTYWLAFPDRLRWERFFLKERKLVSFTHLSMQKKTKKGHFIAFPQSKQYDIRELIRQNFKTSKETPNQKNMMKNILNTLLTEKHINDIETRVLPSEQMDRGPGENGFYFRIKNVTSIKKLKDKIESIGTLEALRGELQAIIANFRNREYFSEEVYAEEKSFVDYLINEGKQILREKREKEEASKGIFKVKMPILKKIKGS